MHRSKITPECARYAAEQSRHAEVARETWVLTQLLCVAYPGFPFQEHEKLASDAVRADQTCWVIDAAIRRDPLDYVRTFVAEWVVRVERWGGPNPR